jgi:outer membrane receptor protein involved in Fe transport
LGFRYFPLEWLSFETAYFILKTDNDGYTDPITGDYELSGKTKREGVEFGVKAVPVKDWTISANFAYIEAKYKKFIQGQQNLAGYRLPWTPRKIGNFEVAYAPETGLGGRISFRWESDALFQDAKLTLINGQPNLQRGVQVRPFKAPDKYYLDLQLSYAFNENIKLIFDATNVIGKAYEGYAYGKEWDTGDYVTNFANPRAFYLTLKMNWDAKEK